VNGLYKNNSTKWNNIMTVRWGIAGLGNIAHRFAGDLTAHCQNGTLQAVAANDVQRAALFATQYQCSHSYGSYLELANDDSVDAVYVATINPLHRNVVELFLNHGKHVLVEKPAFTNIADWDAMAKLAKENHLLLAEAMKSVVFPAYQQLRQFIIDNHIEITTIEAAFGTANAYDLNNRLFDATLSGGATLDVGVYGLWLYVDLCHALNIDVPIPQVIIETDNHQSAVDEHVMFHFNPSQTNVITGKIGASITRDLPKCAVMTGPNITITIEEKWWNPRVINIVYCGESMQISTPEVSGGFDYQIEHVSQLILAKQCHSPILRGESSRKVLEIMETALVQHGFKHIAYPNI
jgi:predicted dehydrogenase